MLIRSTWILTTSAPATIPRSYGLELAKNLHKQMHLAMGDNIIPNLTYSGIVGSCSASKDFLTFSPDNFYKLSLCGLQEQTAKAIADLDLFSSIELFGAKFDVVNREDETSGYETLYHTLIATEPEPMRKFKLCFVTPTAFAQHRTHLPLPVPILMFRSWLERWNHFAPVYLGGDELLVYLSEAITVKYQNTQSRLFSLPKGYVNGFTGDVTLQVLSRTEPLLANVVNLLIQYANFASTGMKTRLGMGQTEIVLIG
jgi:CRISPR-associated endoribonuclease Cas6